MTVRPPLSSRLRPADLLPTSTSELRARKLRAALSVLGISIGIAASVGVLGITRSSEAALLAQIDRLGTNLLTVANGTSLEGQEVELPPYATAMVARVSGVEHVAPTAQLANVDGTAPTRCPLSRLGGLPSERATNRCSGP